MGAAGAAALLVLRPPPLQPHLRPNRSPHQSMKQTTDCQVVETSIKTIIAKGQATLMSFSILSLSTFLLPCFPPVEYDFLASVPKASTHRARMRCALDEFEVVRSRDGSFLIATWPGGASAPLGWLDPPYGPCCERSALPICGLLLGSCPRCAWGPGAKPPGGAGGCMCAAAASGCR